ncbi:MAG: hypothetical protein ABIY55_26405 [Kofleriaceae bacterium]
MLERRLPDGVLDSPAIRRAIVEYPDDDAPRRAYAAWMLSQDHEFAQMIGAFVTAQLRVADAFRASPCADVMALRSWRGDRTFVSAADFRAGDSLRPWFLDDLSSLISLGLIGWPQVYRGCVERVGVRARRFLEIADELFRLAPIRYLVLIGVPEVVDQLAASPHLARIRSFSLPRYTVADDLTDETLATLLASPHVGNLAHLRLVHQQNLTPLAYESVVTAATLPRLSNFEIYAPRIRWLHMDPETYDPRSRSERMIAYDTPIAAMRSTEWTAELQQVLGYVPCVHPEEHYGRGSVDIEAVIEHPIALDANIMARRGAPI